MNSHFTHRGHTVKSSLAEADARQLIEDCLDKNYEVVRELKNNRHNYVARVNTGTLSSLVIKEPRKRNGHQWQRVLSLFRPSEAMRMYNSHLRLQELGFTCPAPILAAEYRPYGLVVDSFFVYRYQEGQPAGTEDASCVAQELQRLHSKGYTRSDPKAQNFLIGNGKVHFIDFKLAKPVLFRKHSTRMEYAHLLHTLPEGIEYLSEKERTSAGFRFAVWLRRAVSDAKRKKREWRDRPALGRTKGGFLTVFGALITYDMMLG